MRSLRTAAAAALVATVGAATLVAASGTAVANPRHGGYHQHSLRGTTSVTTAPGIASTLLGAGVLPLPAPRTSFRFGANGGQLAVTYGFPIVGGDPDLSGPSGDILHAGGITFTNLRKSLTVTNFDIDLAAGKIFATRVNGASARLPLLDLDLSGLTVSQPDGATVLRGIVVRLDAVAAGALNSTFRLALPTDGSLVFGSATVVLRG